MYQVEEMNDLSPKRYLTSSCLLKWLDFCRDVDLDTVAYNPDERFVCDENELNDPNMCGWMKMWANDFTDSGRNRNFQIMDFNKFADGEELVRKPVAKWQDYSFFYDGDSEKLVITQGSNIVEEVTLTHVFENDDFVVKPKIHHSSSGDWVFVGFKAKAYGCVVTWLENCKDEDHNAVSYMLDIRPFCNKDDEKINLCGMDPGRSKNQSNGRRLRELRGKNEIKPKTTKNRGGKEEELSQPNIESGRKLYEVTSSLVRPERPTSQKIRLISFNYNGYNNAHSNLEELELDLKGALDTVEYCSRNKYSLEIAGSTIVNLGTWNAEGENWHKAIRRLIHFGVTRNKFEFDDINVLVFPPGIDMGEYRGLAMTGAWFAGIASDRKKDGTKDDEAYLDIQDLQNLFVHEVGHILGMKHSYSYEGDTYDIHYEDEELNKVRDSSCLMGSDYEKPEQVCFNGHKSWYLGWYEGAMFEFTLQKLEEKRVWRITDLHHYLAGGELVGAVIFKWENFFFMYYSDSDKIVITKGDFYTHVQLDDDIAGSSYFVAALGAGEEYIGDNFTAKNVEVRAGNSREEGVWTYLRIEV